MKKWLSFIILLLTVVSFPLRMFAVSEAAVLFLLISPGARASAMGESFVAIADDATATYWNPAGLALQKRYEFTLMDSNWLPNFASNMYYTFGSFIFPIKNVGTIGANIIYFNRGTQFFTSEDSPEVLGEFHCYDLAITAIYGTEITENLAVGISGKYIKSQLAPIGAGAERGNGTGKVGAVDVGLLYRLPFCNKRLIWGMNLSNMGPKIEYIEEAQADPLPTNLKTGFAYKIFDQKYNKLTISADINKLLVKSNREEAADPFYKAIFTAWENGFEDVIIGVGYEYMYNNLIAIRAGYYYDEHGRVKYPSVGFGIQYSPFRLDWGISCADGDHPVAGTKRFSLTVGSFERPKLPTGDPLPFKVIFTPLFGMSYPISSNDNNIYSISPTYGLNLLFNSRKKYAFEFGFRLYLRFNGIFILEC